MVYLHDFSSPVENLQGDPQTPSRPTRSTDVQPTEHAYTGIITHIGKGVFLTKTTTNSPYCLLTFYGPGLVAEENQHPWFESYGWNGSSWELNHPGSKVTHAAVQDLIDTLQISFDDTGGLNELVTNEYYDAYAYNGIIVDDATAFRQSLYHFMQATETGTDFTPAVVPAADVGAVTDDRLAMLHQGQSAARLGLTTPYVWGESGKLIAGSSGSTSGNVAGYAEHRLVGDFEFRFKMVDCLNAELRIGLMNWTSIQSGIFNLPITDAGHRFNIAYNRTGVNNPSGAIDYSIRVNTVGLNSATSAATISKTNASEDDVFAFRRVGTTITLLVNDVVEYTYGTATAQDLGIVFANVLTTGHAGWTLYDGELDHTINRRYVEIGNGTTTGARDINFGRMVLERMEYNELNIELDGTPASILTDGVTEPGVGEVNVLPYSGRLWFNAADAGKTITGNWRILKKLNLE